MQLEAIDERQYYDEQAGSLSNTLLFLVSFVSVTMGVGAVFGAMNTMPHHRGCPHPRDASRLVSRNAISLVYTLPPAYKERIKAVPGVKQVAASNWFGGFIGSTPDYKNFRTSRWSPRSTSKCTPSSSSPPSSGPPSSAIGGAPSSAPSSRRSSAGRWATTSSSTSVIWKVPFDFLVAGVYDVDPKSRGVSGQLMFFHWKYLDEATQGKSAVGSCNNILIDDPNKAGSISKQIDALFENSDRQTKTETEAAFYASFASMSGNLTLLLNGIALAVAFTILLVTANTMSMAVRERRTPRSAC